MSEADREGVGRPYPSHVAEVEDERQRWREGVLGALSWASAVMGVIAAVFVVPAGMLRWATGPFLVAVVALVLVALAGRLPFRVRAVGLLGTLYLACVLSMATAGISPNVNVALCSVVITATVLLGRAWGIAFLALSAAALLTTGSLLALGVGGRPVDWYVPFDAARPIVLARVAGVFIAASSTLLLSVSMLMGRTEALLRDKADAVDAMNRAREVQEKLQRDLDAQEDAFRRAREMELVGRLAGCAAHDLNNTLTVISSYAKLAIMSPSDAALTAEALSVIENAAGSAALTTGDLRSFGPQAEGPARPVSLSEQVTRSAQLFGRLLPAIEVRLDVMDGAPDVWADEASVQRVITNLALNARDAMRNGGRLTLRVRKARKDESDDRDSKQAFVVLDVEDTGSGMDAGTVNRVFEPFFTTKGAGGTGLGLASVRERVTALGGFVKVESEVGRGTRFSVFWREAAPQAPRSERVASVAKSTARVLVVEDDPQIQKVMALALGRRGYSVSKAGSVDEALGILSEQTFPLLITDSVMPGAPIAQLIDAYRARCPGGRVLLCSGYSSEEASPASSSVDGFLAKPFSIDDLLGAVGRLASESAA